MSHHGLFTKLMKRMVPNELLSTLEYWFSICSTCVKWENYFSDFFQLKCGVRQGGVLSPYLFSVFMDDIISVIHNIPSGCHLGCVNCSIFLYADDILLVAPSISSLQHLINTVEHFLSSHEMILNAKKSCSLRIGPRFNDICQPVCTTGGTAIQWVNNMRYLGVQLVAAKTFRVSLADNVKSYYAAVSSLHCKLKGSASEECYIKLIYAKCVPILLYGLEACELKQSQVRHLDFLTHRTFMRVFKTSSVEIVDECMIQFKLQLFSVLLSCRKTKFMLKLDSNVNSL
jgi:hypothetical protein